MPTFEITAFAVLGLLAWFWFDSLRARDAGVRAARAACESEHLQLLDETISITSLQAVRNDSGQLVLRRVYGFEFSDTGDNRRKGSVVLLGASVLVVNVDVTLVHSGQLLH